MWVGAGEFDAFRADLARYPILLLPFPFLLPIYQKPPILRPSCDFNPILEVQHISQITVINRQKATASLTTTSDLDQTADLL